MSELDEGLDKIIDDQTRNKIAFSPGYPHWRKGFKQAIKEWSCKHRGCEPPKFKPNPYMPPVPCGPCRWCGKEQP